MADHRSIAIEREATLKRLDQALGHLFAARGMTYQAVPTFSKDPDQLGLQQLQHMASLAEQLVGYETLNPAILASTPAVEPVADTQDEATPNTDNAARESETRDPEADTEPADTPARSARDTESRADADDLNADAARLTRQTREALDKPSPTSPKSVRKGS